MHLKIYSSILYAASLSLAMPTPEPARLMTATGSVWTMQSFKRACDVDDTSCAYSFSVNLNDGQAATPCSYDVTGSPASTASYNNVVCGPFVISSSWSGQFGPGNGFQTLAVVDGNQIIYPAYTDKQLQNNTVVSPDQSYTPQNLP